METTNELNDVPEWMDMQFTPEQAATIYDSGIWKQWDDEHIVRFQLFQQNLCVGFARFHGAIENVFGYNVSQYAFVHHKAMVTEYMKKTTFNAAPTFEEITGFLPDKLFLTITTMIIDPTPKKSIEQETLEEFLFFFERWEKFRIENELEYFWRDDTLYFYNEDGKEISGHDIFKDFQMEYNININLSVIVPYQDKSSTLRLLVDKPSDNPQLHTIKQN